MSSVVWTAAVGEVTSLSAELSLALQPAGVRCRVVAVDEPGSLGERLLEMGVTPGTEIQVVRRGFRGDPMQVAVRGYMLTLRREQAARIRVERVP